MIDKLKKIRDILNEAHGKVMKAEDCYPHSYDWLSDGECVDILLGASEWATELLDDILNVEIAKTAKNNGHGKGEPSQGKVGEGL